jgi:hypothetical protein
MLEEIYDYEEIFLLTEYKMIEFFHFYMNLKLFTLFWCLF